MPAPVPVPVPVPVTVTVTVTVTVSASRITSLNDFGPVLMEEPGPDVRVVGAQAKVLAGRLFVGRLVGRGLFGLCGRLVGRLVGGLFFACRELEGAELVLECVAEGRLCAT